MSTLFNLDLKLFTILNDLVGLSNFLDWLIIFLADYLAYLIVAGLVIWLLVSKSDVKIRLQMGVVGFVGALVARFGVAEIIRFFYHRPRPFVYHSVDRLLLESSYSFPSGHTIFFFALAAAVYHYNRKTGNWFFVGAVLIGVSRIIAGVHYPSDILAGAVLGVLTSYICIKCLKPIFRSLLKNK